MKISFTRYDGTRLDPSNWDPAEGRMIVSSSPCVKRKKETNKNHKKIFCSV
jgi:hypothetical protein